MDQKPAHAVNPPQDQIVEILEKENIMPVATQVQTKLALT